MLDNPWDWRLMSPGALGTMFNVAPGGTFPTAIGQLPPPDPTLLAPLASKQPEVTTAPAPGTPPDERLVPTPATQAAPPKTLGNYWDQIMALQKEGKLSPVIAALAKGIGTGGANAPASPHAMQIQVNPIRGEPHKTDANAAQIMEQLVSGGASKAKKSQRRREQDRYDILGGRG